MVDRKLEKSQNKSFNVKLNYNLTKRTQHNMVLAIKAYKRLLYCCLLQLYQTRPLLKLNFEF